ncbi:MAG: adenylate/guanylate cyclase domain-containing protein [Alphaproteobacteria bacterium]|jgi:adenylate cyclase|nr:adenylate/guanylate cyclase domain-containing protein [Alphaproteobacteria bacterium]
MAMDHRIREKWRLIAFVTLFGAAFGLAYAALRMAGGVMPFSWVELEHSTRTGGFIGFCLGLYMFFFVYDDRGAKLRRMSFIMGWIVIDASSTVIIAFAMLAQRGVYALLYGDEGLFEGYLGQEFLLDVLIAFVVFVVVALFMQIRPLLGAGTMWKVLTGRYHHPRHERRIYMFLDIKDSTATAERLGDEKTHALIAEVFFDVDRQIVEHGGEVLSYNGDEIVATWPEADGLMDGRCLRCYGAIIQALRDKAGYFQDKFGVSPEFWAGFHLGPVVIGECGDSKRAIVHIGDTPNTAARLEQQAKDMGRDCLVSGNLLDSLELPPGLKAEAMGDIVLRGHDHDTGIFALAPAAL